MTDSAAWPDDCLLRACAFTEAGTCTVHGDVCPDCPCGTPLHWEPATAALRPPFNTGDMDLTDAVYDALEPLDGFPKGSRGGPRIYRYERWWVVVSSSDFGDIIVGPWGALNG